MHELEPGGGDRHPYSKRPGSRHVEIPAETPVERELRHAPG